jgi:hypothetical protein
MGFKGLRIEPELRDSGRALAMVPAVGEQDAADIEEDCVEGKVHGKRASESAG